MEKLEEIKEKANYCLNCPTRPCTKGCPLGNNIPDFIKCVKEEKFEDAWRILNETTVLQPICGRICPHEKQCQGNCVRGIKGEPVQIGELEAFVGDLAIKRGYKINGNVNEESNWNVGKVTKEKMKFNEEFKKKKNVAIVGSGPSGLTCATYLARKGYSVTIYEKHDKLGGLLRYGIPEFRLDRDVLDAQIKKIIDLGVKVLCNKKLGKDFTIKELCKQYSAIFLGFGANVSRKMNIPGEDLNGVYGGNELLEKNLHPDYKGKKVAVIGGGNVAMDVSRTVKRLGADKVYVIYRRTEEQMPAERKEIGDAKKEGVEFLFQNNIVRINGAAVQNVGNSNGSENGEVNSVYDEYANSVASIECIKTELVKKSDSDRLVPVNIEGSNYVVDMDYVMMAVGSEAEIDIVSALGVKLNKWGYIDVDENFMTSIPNVFAGGDLIGTKATVAWSARNGRDAAEAIARLI